jgi:8-oxo-dGTP pyrophosphatase MutT (NUDIX family)
MGKKTQRAGLIPFYVNDSDECRMMFMKPSDKDFGGAEFQLAKGRVDPGENPLEAAVREANEELGLRESNIKWIKKCGVFLTTHHVFIAEVNSMDDSDFDEFTFETGETIWMTKDEFIKDGRKLHIPIVRQCFALFKRLD